jgi:hypothetical protein
MTNENSWRHVSSLAITVTLKLHESIVSHYWEWLYKFYI